MWCSPDSRHMPVAIGAPGKIMALPIMTLSIMTLAVMMLSLSDPALGQTTGSKSSLNKPTATAAAAPAAAPSDSDSAAVKKQAAKQAASQPATKPSHSRFGHFGSVLSHAANAVQDKTGISKETAARIAITAATGGAGAALLTSASSAKVAGSATSSAATTATQMMKLSAMQASQTAATQAALSAMSRSAAGKTTGKNTGKTTSATGTTLDQQALSASQYLSQITTRAAQGDANAKRGIAALNSAMTTPNSKFLQLEARARTGDTSAVQQMVIWEAQVARAAAGESQP